MFVYLFEIAVKNKLDSLDSKFLDTGSYQSGFKKGMSMQKNLAIVVNQICKNRRKNSERKIYVATDLRKAYDSVKIPDLFDAPQKRVQSDEE